MPVPQYHELFNPTLQAIKHLGGSASIDEMDAEVIKLLGLTDQEAAEPHTQRQTKLQYRMAWARTYLKGYGLLDNSARGIWVITAKGKETDAVDSTQVRRIFRDQRRAEKQKSATDVVAAEEDLDAVALSEAALEQNWREKLLSILLNLAPDAFERLCQRLLRESGFVQVKVTGRSGDGGIDGVGIVQLGGLLGFPVLFQCKRYQGSVSASTIRDFRGSMIGRADRGIVLTTGTFTQAAKTEATRDGAPPIDLVDGEQLLDKLKDLRLGVAVKMIEEISVLPVWFEDI